jgi:hypothetical protein
MIIYYHYHIVIICFEQKKSGSVRKKTTPEKRLLQLCVEGHLGGSTSGSAPWKTMGLTGLDMVEIYGNPWKSMEIYG